MTLTKSSKKYLWLGITFSLLAVLFAVLYYVNIISTMDLFLAVTYVAYFVGLALLYNGAYCRERSHKNSTILNFVLGCLFILLSTGMLIYGFATGKVSFI